MWAKLKGIKIVRAKGRVYLYHRVTGARLKSAPQTISGNWTARPELLAEIAALEAQKPCATPGSLWALIQEYKASPGFQALRPRTQKDYSRVLRWFSEHAGAASPRLLAAVRARQIRDVAARKHGFRFGRYVVQVGRIIWNFGVEYGRVDHNPWRLVSLPKRPKDLPDQNRPWSPAEVALVLSLAPVGLRRAFALSLLGFRPSEIPAMRWPPGELRSIENVSRKTSFDALQAIPDAFKAVFEGERPAITIATTRHGRPIASDNALYKAAGEFLRGLTAKGVVAPGLTLKGCNHTLGSALAERGVDPRTAKDAMQKRTLQTTLHYSRRADTRRNAAAAIKEFDIWLKGEQTLENQATKVGKPERRQE